MNKMEFNPGLELIPIFNPIGFAYGADCFGPVVENRRLDDIRESLLDPDCTGPDIVYTIAMDIGKKKDKALLEELELLFAGVMYAEGRLGREPVRSQGHIHKISPRSGMSTPEVYEIWNGEGVILMQESAKDNPGRCYAVYAKPGEVVIVPPGWAHATVSVNPDKPLIFGAWCDRGYGFEYDDVRRHKGLAWFPVINKKNNIEWVENERYKKSELICKKPGHYKEFGIIPGKSIYETFEKDPYTFLYVSDPRTKEFCWQNFEP